MISRGPHRTPTVAARAVLLAFLLAFGAAAQNHLVVRLKNGTAITPVAQRHGLQVVAALSGSGSGLYVINSAIPADLAMAALKVDSDVSSVESDAPVALPEAARDSHLRLAGSPDLTALASAIQPYTGKYQTNPYSHGREWTGYEMQPAAAIIRNAEAHQFATGGGIVGVLDTGIDNGHPVLAGSVMPGWDFVNGLPGGFATPSDRGSGRNSFLDQSTTSILDQTTSTTVDSHSTTVLSQSTTSILDQSTTSILDGMGTPANEYGHGTMVAGIIHLVAPTARLLPVKVFDANGGSCVSLIVQGIYYAVDHGAHVINMSFSMTQPSLELQRAIAFAASRGVILVASAGNEGQSILVYPAADAPAIGVGATNNQDVRSSFSNYGTVALLAAPGENIITTYPQNRYAAGSGTSFSAPMVAGGAALLVQLHPQIEGTLALQYLSRAVSIGQGLGAGRLDLYQVVQ